MQKIIITGGSGFIGTHLSKFLLEKNYEIVHLSRTPGVNNGIRSYYWDPEKFEMDEQVLRGTDFIIHLAGAGIADKRWTKKRKEEIITSRVNGPVLLRKKLAEQNIRLKGFFSSSGINYFGSITTDKVNTENDPPGDDYIAQVVIEWENAVQSVGHADRIAMFRFGLVLDDKEGGLPKLARPVKMGVGAALGSGRQWVPWIHIEDVVNIFYFALTNEKVRGIYNAVAPEQITNQQMTKIIAEILNRKLFLPNVPAFVLKLFLGELSTLVLDGSRASSQKLIQEGFQFKYKTFEEALRSIYQYRVQP